MISLNRMLNWRLCSKSIVQLCKDRRNPDAQLLLYPLDHTAWCIAHCSYLLPNSSSSLGSEGLCNLLPPHLPLAEPFADWSAEKWTEPLAGHSESITGKSVGKRSQCGHLYLSQNTQEARALFWF